MNNASMLFYYSFISGSCDGWENGIGNTKLINNFEGECRLFIPSHCELSIRSGWFDVNRFSHECKDIKMKVSKEKLNKRLQESKNLKKIGYPRVEDYPNKAIYSEDYFMDITPKDFIDMEDPEVSQNIKDNIEFILDISNEDSHILHIDLKKNYTRAEEAKKLRKKILDEDISKGNVQRIDKDVLIIYIDNISRPHFHRKMKKLDKWISQYAGDLSFKTATTSVKKNIKSSTNNAYSQSPKMQAYEFFRFHSKTFNTYPNINTIFYGMTFEVVDNKEDVLFKFRENGYIIGSFSDECKMEMVDVNENTSFSASAPIYDHYAASLACDSNYDISGNMDIVLNKGRNSPFRRCMYGQSMYEIQLNYVMQFWDAYSDNRKIFKTRSTESHEATGELVKYIIL